MLVSMLASQTHEVANIVINHQQVILNVRGWKDQAEFSLPSVTLSEQYSKRISWRHRGLNLQAHNHFDLNRSNCNYEYEQNLQSVLFNSKHTIDAVKLNFQVLFHLGKRVLITVNLH